MIESEYRHALKSLKGEEALFMKLIGPKSVACWAIRLLAGVLPAAQLGKIEKKTQHNKAVAAD